MDLDLTTLDEQTIRKLSNKELAALAERMHKRRSQSRQEQQILYYDPVSDEAAKIHASTANTLGIFGGNRSGKTETALVQIIALATGLWPQRHDYWFKPKFRGPVACRIIVVSFLQQLYPVFLPKLQYFKWTGPDKPGGMLGHWGWVPRSCLIQGQWDKSWSTKHSTLSVLCRDPENHQKVLGESIIQFMSHGNDPEEFASGTFHHILHDEPPPEPIWRESKSRLLDNGGINYIAMTWSDDPAVNQDWIHDEVLEAADGNDTIEIVEISTLDNQHLNQEAVSKEVASWSEDVKAIRIFGKSLTFANRVHPLFTDIPRWWSLARKKVVSDPGDSFAENDVVPFCHVADEDPPVSYWPCVFLLDPHPRKPHMFMWVTVTPGDDWLVIADGACEGDCTDTRVMVEAMEIELSLNTVARFMDPNMGRSPVGGRREVTWQDEFDDAGLRLDLADDGDPGRRQVDLYLQPDPHTLRPRLTVHRRCQLTIQQMKRYSWDDYNKALNRDQKQKARDKYSDYPTLLKYLANYDPTFRNLNNGPMIIQTRGYDRASQPLARRRAQGA